MGQFMRWTHEVTEGNVMVVDLQGVKTDDGYVLTDPCILCSDVTRFGSGNLGPRALQRCLDSLAAHLDMPASEDTFTNSNIALTVSPYVAAHEPEKIRWGGPSPDLADVVVDRPVDSANGLMTKAAVMASSALSSAKRKASLMPTTVGHASVKGVTPTS